jgi:hypothetical protein
VHAKKPVSIVSFAQLGNHLTRVAGVSFQNVLADERSTSLVAIDRSGRLYATQDEELVAFSTPVRAVTPVASISRLGGCAVLADGTVFSSRLNSRVPPLSGICGALMPWLDEAHDGHLLLLNAAGQLVVA